VANRLALESSPYLLQHKDNPVDWYPWGQEAFTKARAENKPVFLSIGYSTCHWCHVMEHESFETLRVADALNRDFVSIKVDREERPDVDDIYMQAVQMMTGSGGWPLSLFLAPDGRPFYGGTYFPPDDRWGRPGFLRILSAIAEAWKTRREELESSAEEMLGHLRAEAGAALPEAAVPGPEIFDAALASLERQFDPTYGGFGGAPKFPPTMRLELLIRLWRRTGSDRAREMVQATLRAMAAGGMYDQIGGGFHRYSVDARWLVPHFEKMLYDNAMLARLYTVAYRAFGDPEDARVVRETLDYLLKEMTPPGGGFFAAQDADSGGEEGTFYVWSPKSLEAAVGPDAAPVVAARFGVTSQGNFEHGDTVLSVVRTLPGLAAEFGRTEEEIAAVLRDARRKMYDVRAQRVWPGTDDKLLTDWTALAISAFALAGRVLEEPRYEAASREAADRILENAVRDGRLLHRPSPQPSPGGRGGPQDIPGFATDYAFFIEALLDLYEATFEPRYFAQAVRLQRVFDAEFEDPRGGYFLSAAGHDGLIVRPKETYDGATPSSNSVAASNLLRLALFTGEDAYRKRAGRISEGLAPIFAKAPTAFPRLLSALDLASAPSREVVLSGEPGREDFEALRRAVFASPNPNRVVAHADSAASVPELSALAEGRAGRRANAFVCEGFVCKAPVSDPEALRRLLDA
jgi:uncharacterized protein YyaL (SSP411 family)